MAGDDFPTRLAAFTEDDDEDGGDSLPSAAAVLAGVLAPLRGADRSSAGTRYEVADTDHVERRYAFACPLTFAGVECTSRLVVRRNDDYVYARHAVEPPTVERSILDRVTRASPVEGYDALDVSDDLVARLETRRRTVVGAGIDSRVTTPRLTDAPVGFELRFETRERAPPVSVTGYADGRDYLDVPLPDLALRAVTAERDAID